MSWLIHAITLGALVFGVSYGWTTYRRQYDRFHLGTLTAIISILGISAFLINVFLVAYILATFNGKYDSSAIIPQVAIVSGRVRFYCFLGAVIGSILLFIRHKCAEQGAAANP